MEVEYKHMYKFCVEHYDICDFQLTDIAVLSDPDLIADKFIVTGIILYNAQKQITRLYTHGLIKKYLTVFFLLLNKKAHGAMSGVHVTLAVCAHV